MPSFTLATLLGVGFLAIGLYCISLPKGDWGKRIGFLPEYVQQRTGHSVLLRVTLRSAGLLLLLAGISIINQSWEESTPALAEDLRRILAVPERSPLFGPTTIVVLCMLSYLAFDRYMHWRGSPTWSVRWWSLAKETTWQDGGRYPAKVTPSEFLGFALVVPIVCRLGIEVISSAWAVLY